MTLKKQKRSQPLKKRLKKEYYRFIDGLVRSHSLQKIVSRTIYLVCFVISVILATLLYLEGK